MPKIPVTIIGAGSVGKALALALPKQKFIVENIISRTKKSAEKIAKIVKANPIELSLLKNISFKGIIFITVPDDAIKNVVDILVQSKNKFSNTIIFHTSGALSTSILQPLKKKSASVGSFHPLQTFKKNEIQKNIFQNIWFAIEGDKKAIAVGKNIASSFKAQSFILKKEQKTLYHIGAVFASNYFVTLLSVVEEIGKKIGIPKEKVISIYEPIIAQTLHNVKTSSAVQSLTGPIARNDVQTIQKHIQELSKKKNKHLLPLYSTLGLATVKIKTMIK